MIRLIISLLLCHVSVIAVADEASDVVAGVERSVLEIAPGDSCDATWGWNRHCDTCKGNDSACGANCCFGSLCDPPCRQRNWVDVDALLFFNRGFRVPALVSQSAAGTPRAQVGILGDPANTVVLGNQRLGDDVLFGGRIELGRWLDDAGSTAIVGSLFGFSDTANFGFPTDPNTIISRPFFNVDPNVNALDAELVNFPGVVSGTIGVLADTNVSSGAIGLRKRLWCCSNPADCCHSRRVDGFVGFRSFSFDEALVISERLLASGGLIPANTTFDVLDRFETDNRFLGIEFGLISAWQWQRWSLELESRIAIGNLSQDVVIDGATTITSPGQPPLVQPYGILAGPSNIGTYERDHFGVLSQFNLEVGYQLSRRLRVTMGYSLIVLNDIVRPGELIDFNVNGTQIDPNVADSGPARPAFDWNSETLALHGLRLGFEFAF